MKRVLLKFPVVTVKKLVSHLTGQIEAMVWQTAMSGRKKRLGIHLKCVCVCEISLKQPVRANGLTHRQMLCLLCCSLF